MIRVKATRKNDFRSIKVEFAIESEAALAFFWKCFDQLGGGAMQHCELESGPNYTNPFNVIAQAVKYPKEEE